MNSHAIIGQQDVQVPHFHDCILIGWEGWQLLTDTTSVVIICEIVHAVFNYFMLSFSSYGGNDGKPLLNLSLEVIKKNTTDLADTGWENEWGKCIALL